MSPAPRGGPDPRDAVILTGATGSDPRRAVRGAGRRYHPVVSGTPVASPAARRRKRILIVDDDPAIGRMLARLFERDHDVVIAGDGPSAIALASRAPAPDLALLDIMMPVMDGLALALRFKAMPETRRMPVIFITARSGSTDVIRGIQAGARSYIVKPFKLEEVREKVHKALGA